MLLVEPTDMNASMINFFEDALRKFFKGFAAKYTKKNGLINTAKLCKEHFNFLGYHIQ